MPYISWKDYSAANGNSPSTYSEWSKTYGPESGRAVNVADVDSRPPPKEPGHAAPSEYKPRPASKPAAPYSSTLGSVAPTTFEEDFANGASLNNEAVDIRDESRRRWKIIGRNEKIAELPPDVADLAFKSAGGRVRRARGGSSRSAIMGPADLTSSSYRRPASALGGGY